MCFNRAGFLTISPHTDRAEPHGQTCLDLNINLDSNLLLKAAYFIWWEEVGHICLPLQSLLTLWSGGAPAAASGFLMKMQGNRKQVQSRLTFPTALLRPTMRHRSMIFSELSEWCGGVCPSLRPKYQPDTWGAEWAEGWVKNIQLTFAKHECSQFAVVLLCVVYNTFCIYCIISSFFLPWMHF